MDEINVSEYLFVLVRRWRIIFAVGILAAIVAAGALLILPRTFRGQAVLIFPKNDQSAATGLLSKLAGLSGGLDVSVSGSSSGSGMYSEILQSRTLSKQVLDDLQLGRVGLDAPSLQKLIDVEVDKDGGMVISCYAPTSWTAAGKLPWLDQKCRGKNTGQKAAYLSAEMTNDYIRRLYDFDKEHSLNTGRENREFLQQEVTKNRQQLADAEEALRAFKEKHPMLPTPETSSQQAEFIVTVRSKQMEAQTELGEVLKSIQEAKNVVDGQKAYETAAKVIQDNPIVSQLKSQLADSEVRRAELLENMTETHPDVVSLTQNIDKLNEKISKEVARVTSTETLQINPVKQSLVQDLANLEIRRSGVQARLEAVNGVMSHMESELSGMAKDQMYYVRLTRDTKALELVYTSLLTQLSQARVAEAKDPDGFTVLDWAMPEKTHFKPKRTMTVAATFILGIMAGCCIALIQESRRPTKRHRSKATAG